MLDNIFGELLKHRRVLIEKLDTKSDVVRDAINAELEKTDRITQEIEKAVEDLKQRING